MIYYKRDELGDRTIRDFLANLGDYAISDEVDADEVDADEVDADEVDDDEVDDDEHYVVVYAEFHEGMPYREYLRTWRWAVIRRLAFQKYGYQCQACTSTIGIHVHHRTYTHLYHEEAHLSDLAVLCALCHVRHHAKEIDIERLVPRQRSEGEPEIAGGHDAE